CPGPQVIDVVGDAPNDYPGGDGSNIDTLDIVSASFATVDAATLRVTLTLKDLEVPPPPANFVSAYWTVYWTYNGTLYYAQATSDGAAGVGLFRYTDGIYTSTFNSVSAINGTATSATAVPAIPIPRSVTVPAQSTFVTGSP